MIIILIYFLVGIVVTSFFTYLDWKKGIGVTVGAVCATVMMAVIWPFVLVIAVCDAIVTDRVVIKGKNK